MVVKVVSQNTGNQQSYCAVMATVKRRWQLWSDRRIVGAEKISFPLE
jgi:hypothetical protein